MFLYKLHWIRVNSHNTNRPVYWTITMFLQLQVKLSENIYKEISAVYGKRWANSSVVTQEYKITEEKESHVPVSRATEPAVVAKVTE